MIDYNELAKLFIFLPIELAVIGILYLEFVFGWITFQVIISSLIAWISLVIGYYLGKLTKNKKELKEICKGVGGK